MKMKTAKISPLWQRLVQQKQEAAQKVIDAIIANYRPDRIIIFGSLARGDIHEGSDLDLLIVKNDCEARFLDRTLSVLESAPPDIGIEPFVYTDAELQALVAQGNAFVLTALEEGIVVYERQQPDRSQSLVRASSD